MQPATRLSRARRWLVLLSTLVLACGLPTPCFALDLLSDVSKERAKEIGIKVTMGPSANNDVRVQVDFDKDVLKKEFKYAYMDLTRGGKRLVSTYIMPFKPAPNMLHFEIYLDPEAVADATVTITVWGDPITGNGYRIKLKDFVEKPAAR